MGGIGLGSDSWVVATQSITLILGAIWLTLWIGYYRRNLSTLKSRSIGLLVISAIVWVIGSIGEAVWYGTGRIAEVTHHLDMRRGDFVLAPALLQCMPPIAIALGIVARWQITDVPKEQITQRIVIGLWLVTAIYIGTVAVLW